MANVLISDCSRTGTTRQAAQQLQQLTGWSIGEVRDARPRTGLGGDLRCAIESLLARPRPVLTRARRWRDSIDSWS